MPPASSSTVWRKAADVGRAPGHGPDGRRHRRCRARPARPSNTGCIDDPPPGPPAAARAVAGVPAGTRSPPARGSDSDAASSDIPVGTRSPRGRGSRPGRRVAGRSRGNVPRCRQRLRVNVQHHLIPVAGRPPVESARQRRLRHRSDGVRLPLQERRLFHVGRCVGRLLFHAVRRPSPRGCILSHAVRRVGRVFVPAAVPRRRAPRLVARRLQRPPQHRSDLRRQPPADNHHPVLVHPRPQRAARLPPPFLRLLHVPVDAPPRAGDAFHVLRRAREGHLEQGLLVLGSGHPRDRAHLRVGDLAAAHGVAQPGQLPEGARHAHVLAGGPLREPGAPAQPLRARQATVPALLLVELADEDEQLVGGGLDAGRQLGDAVAESCQLRSAVAGRRRRSAEGRLVGRPGGRWKIRGGCRRDRAIVSGHEPL